MKETYGEKNVKLVETPLELTYAVDGATTNPRSGNIVLDWKVTHVYEVTTPTGVKRVFRGGVVGTIQLHEANLERMKLVGSE